MQEVRFGGNRASPQCLAELMAVARARETFVVVPRDRPPQGDDRSDRAAPRIAPPRFSPGRGDVCRQRGEHAHVPKPRFRVKNKVCFSSSSSSVSASSSSSWSKRSEHLHTHTHARSL